MRTRLPLAFAAVTILVLITGPAARAADPKPRTEEQKIEALIEHVRGLGDRAVFVRNGSDHSAADAAEHMARKRKSAGSRVKTAREFITHCASKSSVSGKPYQIRFKDGKTVTAEAYLTEQLGRLEAGK